MFKHPSRSIALLVLALSAGVAGRADAQLGRIGKKLHGVVTGAVAPQPSVAGVSASATTGGARPGSLGTLTAELLSSFESGLKAEVAERQRVIAAAPKVLSYDAYQSCTPKAYQSAEAQKLVKSYPSDMSSPEGQKAYLAISAKLAAVVAGRCGPDPATIDNSKLAGALAAADAMGAKTAGVESNDYYMLKERVLPFCSMLASKKSMRQGQSTVGVPARGGLEYVYQQPEADALTAACPGLLPLLKATL